MQAEAELGVASAEAERLREEVADGARALAEVRVREQVAEAQRDQAQEAVDAENALRLELDAQRVQVESVKAS
ncbi:hypothetical protein U5801_18395 [Lamprobacter modestohalophilus]|uniref:hypothetical protein n=1 Tax=Lamprobacter modestohalophilus TaxID=1064514 RepID=UPI002ADEE8BB|nr:hypothetical protein [Lamprobacter modestohalophilus]MEA1051756.1 hypothetical protein [Lamprobacter modestohalophilus]